MLISKRPNYLLLKASLVLTINIFSFYLLNQLDLIAYDTKEELKEKLLYSIREGSQGFGFA